MHAGPMLEARLPLHIADAPCGKAMCYSRTRSEEASETRASSAANSRREWRSRSRMRAEKWLNAFLRFIALLERMGDALGTLAFIWATVAVLGGFSEHLGRNFVMGGWIIVVEGFRAFSRQSRLDDQFLFKTTGAIKLKRMELGSGSLYYMNAAMMTASLWTLVKFYFIYPLLPPQFMFGDLLKLLGLLVIIHKLGFYTFIGYMSKKESHILFQLYPIATLLMAGFLFYYTDTYCCYDWIDYSFIFLWFGIYILARFGSPGDNCPFHKKVKVVARLLRAAFVVAAIFGLWFWLYPLELLMVCGTSVLGNLQIPMALVRILLSGWSGVFLEDIKVDTEDKTAWVAVTYLYMMVFGQGMLYMAACVLVSFSFWFRRSLALGCGLVDKLGVESVDLYYEQAYDTFLHESLFNTTKKMGLATFAIDCLDPDTSRDKKCAAVRILDSFLQKHKTSNSNDTKLVSLITTSTKAVTTLISMMGWTVKEDADMRLFAAKVIAHIAPYVQIVGIPAAMQKVSSLLDAQDQQGDIQIPVNDNGSNNSSFSNRGVNEPTVRGCSPIYKFFIFMMAGIHRFWQHLDKLWLIPHKESNEKASLPALGMQILEGLAQDLHNCKEISRATELLPKIIGFISCMHGTTAAQREEISTSSLKLVAKLASVKGEIGITLGQDLYENAFLIGNLAEILELEGTSCYLEQSKLAMDIIAKIAMDKKTRQKIWTVQVIIDKLMQAFLRDDEPLAPLAGEALAMLATESPGHCSDLLDTMNYELIRDLANKIQRGQHVYQAASLLQKLCENPTQLMLSHQDSKDHLSSTLTVVLGRIVDAEDKQMEALISLASQICNAGITPVSNSSVNAVAFVEKLVGELKARKIPGADEFPDMRRLLVQLTLCIAESCDGYAFIFKQHGMMDVLSKVEQYMGLVSEEHGTLHDMVARAKWLIGAATSSTCPP